METLYNVTQTSELTGIHPQTLRHYEKIKLLIPRRTLGGNRRYSNWDLDKLNLIRELTTAGINLEGVGVILQLREENNVLRQQLLALRGDSIFLSGKKGTHLGFSTKQSLKDRIRLWKIFRKRANLNLRYQQLSIGAPENAAD